MTHQLVLPHQAGFERSGLRRIWTILGPDRTQIVWALIFRLFQSFALGMAYAATLWVVIDLANGRPLGEHRFGQVLGIMVLSLVLQMVFSFLSVRLSWQATYRAVGRLRQAVLRHISELPMGFHLGRERGDLSNVLTSDMEMIEAFMADALARLAQAVGLPLIIFAFMLTQDWRLAIAMTISVVIGLPVLGFTSRHLAKLGIKRADIMADASGRVVEFTLGIRVLRAFGGSALGNERFRAALSEFRDISIRLVRELVSPVLIFIGIVLLGVAVTYLAVGLLLPQIDRATAIIALVLAFSMYAPLVALVSVTEQIRIADVSLMRIDRVLSAEPLPRPAKPKVLNGYDVDLERVGFGYGDGPMVLNGITFSVPENTMTAIVGPSGAGKSTLLNLIARFWDPTEGRICIGGTDLRDAEPEAVIAKISFVFQNVYLFSGSIRENIAMGHPSATEAQIEAAARAAQAHEFILALPDGYDTQVGEGGARLSGGERQRVSIARAILKDAQIVLLDEASAAIDPINERALQIALGNLVKGRSLIVVAHKLSTIEAADQIVVLDKGRMVERGDHASLLAQGGLYHQLFTQKSQARNWTLSNTQSEGVS